MDRSESLWRFSDYKAFHELQEKLDKANISSFRHSSTVSYFLTDEEIPVLKSYELHASYTGRDSDSGVPEVEKTYLKHSYRIFKSDDGLQWITESRKEEIEEGDFYSMVLYSNPERVLNIQQLNFRLNGGEYIAELNFESRSLILIGLNSADKIPNLLTSMVEPIKIDRSQYLLALLKHNGGIFSGTDIDVRHLEASDKSEERRLPNNG